MSVLTSEEAPNLDACSLDQGIKHSGDQTLSEFNAKDDYDLIAKFLLY